MLTLLLLHLSLPDAAAASRWRTAWCRDLLARSETLERELVSGAPVRSRRIGRGAQGVVYLVRHASGVCAEKVMFTDSDFQYPGLRSMWDVTRLEVFQLEYVDQLMRRLGVPLRTPRVFGVTRTNRHGILTDAVIAPANVEDRGNPAPTIVRELIRGQSHSRYLRNTRVTLERRLELLQRKNEFVRCLQRAIATGIEPAHVVYNEVDEDRIEMVSPDGERRRHPRLANRITLRGVRGSPLRDGVVNFSTFDGNVIADKNGWVLIDSD